MKRLAVLLALVLLLSGCAACRKPMNRISWRTGRITSPWSLSRRRKNLSRNRNTLPRSPCPTTGTTRWTP